jgi:hypothetical protein
MGVVPVAKGREFAEAVQSSTGKAVVRLRVGNECVTCSYSASTRTWSSAPTIADGRGVQRGRWLPLCLVWTEMIGGFVSREWVLTLLSVDPWLCMCVCACACVVTGCACVVTGCRQAAGERVLDPTARADMVRALTGRIHSLFTDLDAGVACTRVRQLWCSVPHVCPGLCTMCGGPWGGGRGGVWCAAWGPMVFVRTPPTLGF